EILTWKLSPSDRLAIIASDGVFEFLTSQAVVDLIVKFKNPLEAAKHVVAEDSTAGRAYCLSHRVGIDNRHVGNEFVSHQHSIQKKKTASYREGGYV
ncbi:MAG: hypothetical protein V4474_03950, partial [Patescibacteria group bacterium]